VFFDLSKYTFYYELDHKAFTGWNESNDPDTGNLTKQIHNLLSDHIDDMRMSDLFDLKIKFKIGEVLTIF
jgi:hypothetical protein